MLFWQPQHQKASFHTALHVFAHQNDCTSLDVCLYCSQIYHCAAWYYFKSKALAGRCGITDWILHTDDTSSLVWLLKLLPFAILNYSPVKCFKNGGTCGLDFPCHSPVSRMFSNLYLSWGGNSTRKQISGFLNFLDLIKGAPSVLTTIKSAFFPLAQGSCWMNFWYTTILCLLCSLISWQLCLKHSIVFNKLPMFWKYIMREQFWLSFRTL